MQSALVLGVHIEIVSFALSTGIIVRSAGKDPTEFTHQAKGNLHRGRVTSYNRRAYSLWGVTDLFCERYNCVFRNQHVDIIH